MSDDLTVVQRRVIDMRAGIIISTAELLHLAWVIENYYLDNDNPANKEFYTEFAQTCREIADKIKGKFKFDENPITILERNYNDAYREMQNIANNKSKLWRKSQESPEVTNQSLNNLQAARDNLNKQKLTCKKLYEADINFNDSFANTRAYFEDQEVIALWQRMLKKIEGHALQDHQQKLQESSNDPVAIVRKKFFDLSMHLQSIQGEKQDEMNPLTTAMDQFILLVYPKNIEMSATVPGSTLSDHFNLMEAAIKLGVDLNRFTVNRELVGDPTVFVEDNHDNSLATLSLDEQTNTLSSHIPGSWGIDHPMFDKMLDPYRMLPEGTQVRIDGEPEVVKYLLEKLKEMKLEPISNLPVPEPEPVKRSRFGWRR